MHDGVENARGGTKWDRRGCFPWDADSLTDPESVGIHDLVDLHEHRDRYVVKFRDGVKSVPCLHNMNRYANLLFLYHICSSHLVFMRTSLIA